MIFIWPDSPHWTMASSFTRFLDHTQRRTTVGRTPLDEWSARRRDLYLTIHNTHNRHPSIPPVGFEPTISKGERPQTYPVDHAGPLGPAHSMLEWTGGLVVPRVDLKARETRKYSFFCGGKDPQFPFLFIPCLIHCTDKQSGTDIED